MDYTVTASGLQQDQPPAIGDLSSLTVVILENDNAEGILEIRLDHVNFTGKSQNKDEFLLCKNDITFSVNVCFILAFFLSVEENVGTLLLPVVRRVGSYGIVSVQFISRGLSATSDLDYILKNGTLTFVQGQNSSHINVTIVDDLDR